MSNKQLADNTTNSPEPLALWQKARKVAILDALERFVRQRPGLEYGNYGDVRAYRSELRGIAKDRHHAETLLTAVRWREGITADDLLAASRDAYSGRLEIDANLTRCNPPKGRIDYCAGQYYPTEYRKAVCAVLAQALWVYAREHALPAPARHTVDLPSKWVGSQFIKQTLTPKPVGIHEACAIRNAYPTACINDLYRATGSDALISAGDWLRRYFRREFGRGIGSRWFN